MSKSTMWNIEYHMIQTESLGIPGPPSPYVAWMDMVIGVNEEHDIMVKIAAGKMVQVDKEGI